MTSNHMTADELIRQRLHNQLLAKMTARRPEEIVAALGAVQSQDYTGAKWALAQRAVGLANADVDRAFDEGRILRTHVLRPTWHFVAPADIRWMLALTAPRIHGASASYYRKFELEDKAFARCHTALTRALEGGKHLTRVELRAALRKARIACDDPLRFGLMVMHAELSGVICSGPRRGKQLTYALLEERVPPAPVRTRDEALAELTRRYVSSHGPVTVRDFNWWSGLSMPDAKAGFALIASELEQRVLGDCTYWSIASQSSRRTRPARTLSAALLPNFDEYFIAYKDRDVVLRGVPWGSDGWADVRPEFAHLLAIDGRLTGTWKRTFSARSAGVELQTFRPLKKPERAAVDDAVSRYSDFLGVPATLTHA